MHNFFNRILAVLLLSSLSAVHAEDRYSAQRDDMLRAIERDTRLTSFATDIKRLDAKVLQAMATVPRHQFVLPASRKHAYENRPLPIGYGQTISQPFIVALMTDLLNLESGDVVLEIGTGSGYQAAVLAEITPQVYTMEIIRPLAKQAARRLQTLGYGKVRTRIGDGYYGWKEAGPFDGIIVTAAASHVPPPLVDQLVPGGRMIIPVGSQFLTQQLMVIDKLEDGSIRTQQILPVAFVPLTDRH